MPNKAKGARLYLRTRAGRSPVYIIRDTGQPDRSTGTSDRRQAEIALALYIAQRDQRDGPRSAEQMTVADVLAIYGEQHAPHVADPARIGYAIDALLPYWCALPVAAIKGETCRRYVAARGVSPSTARRELGVLSAALTHCEREGYLLAAPKVWKPAGAPPRDRWLTRDEAARLLRAARSLRIDGRHLADFVLAGIYTGSRKATILATRLDHASTEGGWIDTEAGVYYRRAQNKVETAKRQTPVRLPRNFLAHVRRRKAAGARYLVEDYQGRRVADIRKGWVNAVQIAKLDGITPHVLRHTCATWMMQAGADPWAVAGFLGMGHDVLMRVYGHHHPDFMASAVEALETRRR